VARYSFNLHRSCRAAPAPVPVPPDAPAFRVESSRSLEESQVPVEVKVPVTFLYPVLGDVVSILGFDQTINYPNKIIHRYHEIP